MNDDIAVKTAARERLFDAVLAEAVAAERADAPPHRSRQWLLVATILLATLVTIGVALLQAADRGDEAQDPDAFDPLFPRIERRFHRDQLAVQLRSVEHVRQLPEGPLPPVAVLPSGRAGEEPVPLAVLEALLGRGGVRCLTIDGDSGLPISAWRAIAALPDLEELSIHCEVEAESLRELRHASRLKAIAFGKVRFRMGKDLIDAVLELPRLDSVSLVWQELPSPVLAALAGLPDLHSLYIEACDTEPDWIEAIAGLRSLRWLGLAVGRFKNGILTAADLRRFGALPRLESLMLAKVDIAAADYAALPDSLQVVSLAGSVPAAVMRDLLLRPKLRGLSVGNLELEAESVLCELLPTATLERFGTHGGLSGPLSRALGRMPRLRHLSFAAGRDVASCLERVVHMQQLEHLEFHASVPASEQLAVLRDLPALRRVVINSVGDGSEYTADLDALQQVLGPRVHLVVH